MKTLITMQRLGCKNHPKWRFIVRGQKKSMKGKYIEELGLWLPQKRKTVQRSLVFNKPRILHWLGMGARPTHRVKTFLSYIGYMPSRIDFYGNSSKYQEQKELHRTYNIWQESRPILRKYHTKIQLRQKHQEDDNKIVREHLMILQKIKDENYEKMKDVETAAESIQRLEQERIKEGLDDIPYKIDQRSKEFYQLRELLDRCEKDQKRESDMIVISERLNRLSEKGIMSHDDYQKYVLKYVDEDTKIKLLSADQQHQYLRRKRLEEIMIQRKQRVEENIEMMTPLSEAQAGQYLIEEIGCNQEQAMEITYELFKAAEVSHTLPSKQDLMELMDTVQRPNMNGPEWEDIKFLFKRAKVELENGEGYIPVTKTIHSFPQLNIYNPEEYYDYDEHNKGIDDDFGNRLNYDKAYTCNGVAEIATQQKSREKARTRVTYQKRTMKRKKYYSTVQNVSVASSNYLYHMKMFEEIRYTLNGF